MNWKRNKMYLLLLAVIYIAFISLGLPDSLLGSAWPTIRTDFDVPLSFWCSLYCTSIKSYIDYRVCYNWSWMCPRLSLYYPFYSKKFWRRKFTGYYRHSDGKCLCWLNVHASDLRSDCQLYEFEFYACLS